MFDLAIPGVLGERERASASSEGIAPRWTLDEEFDRGRQLRHRPRTREDGDVGIRSQRLGRRERSRVQGGMQDLADLTEVRGDDALSHAHVLEELRGRTEELASVLVRNMG